MNKLLLLGLLGLFSSAPLSAQSRLMTEGDVLGSSSTWVLQNVAPNTRCMIIPSFLSNGSNALINMSGDPNDALLVGVDLASTGIRFTATSNSQGTATFNLSVPGQAGLLDRAVYLQGFEYPVGGSGVDMFNNFSNRRTITLNNANRWQPAQSNAPVAAALQAFVAYPSSADAQGNDQIFACGGGPAVLTDVDDPFPTSDQAWLYDTTNETHTLLPGNMNISRAFHNLVRLQDGRFMAIGGTSGPFGSPGNYYTQLLDSAEIYDPATGTWTLTAPMSEHRGGANATLLPDGRVIVAGGSKGNGNNQLGAVTDLLSTSLRSSEIYDPVTNTWTAGPNLSEPKAGAGAITLTDGRWMIAGGITYFTIFGIPIPDFSDVISIYNPATNSFTSGGTMREKRALFNMSLLGNGKVFIGGGAGGDILNIGPIANTEVYNPASNSSSNKPNLSKASCFGVAVTLKDGRVMFVGGAEGTIDDPLPIANCWLYDDSTGQITNLANMPESHAGGVVAIMEDGTVFISGGESDNGSAGRAARSYSGF